MWSKLGNYRAGAIIWQLVLNAFLDLGTFVIVELVSIENLTQKSLEETLRKL